MTKTYQKPAKLLDVGKGFPISPKSPERKTFRNHLRWCAKSRAYYSSRLRHTLTLQDFDRPLSLLPNENNSPINEYETANAKNSHILNDYFSLHQLSKTLHITTTERILANFIRCWWNALKNATRVQGEARIMLQFWGPLYTPGTRFARPDDWQKSENLVLSRCFLFGRVWCL